jgi:ATP-dependent Clp protease ATP-binding subunit ClpC
MQAAPGKGAGGATLPRHALLGMIERFNDSAKRVVVFADDEARLFGHDHVGTEHLFLSLMHDSDSAAVMLLGLGDVTLEAARAAVEDIVGRGTVPESRGIPCASAC